MTGMLASVNCLEEAQQIVDVGVDIIDLKQPAQGALGALAIDEVKTIVDFVANRVPVSATIGDLPMQPELVSTATKAMAATAVDYVKIGFFPEGDWQGTLAQLSELTRANCRLIAVLFADQQPDFSWIEKFSECGFSGVMLDTVDKTKGSLTSVLSLQEISRFVSLAQNYKLICGLAGSLTASDIPMLLPYQPDYLGFRGALCQAGNRTAVLDPDAVLNLQQMLIQTPYINPVTTHVQENLDHH